MNDAMVNIIDAINHFQEGMIQTRKEMERFEFAMVMHPTIYEILLKNAANHLRRWDMNWWYRTWYKIIHRVTEEDMVPIREFLCKHDPEGKY